MDEEYRLDPLRQEGTELYCFVVMNSGIKTLKKIADIIHNWDDHRTPVEVDNKSKTQRVPHLKRCGLRALCV